MTHTSFKAITELWPDLTAFAAAIGCTYPTAAAMRHRNSIDGAYFNRLVEAAREIGHDEINLELLCTLAAQRKQAASST